MRAKLENNKLIYPSNFMKIDSEWVTNPTDEQLISIGYKELRQVEVDEVINEFEETETEIIQYFQKQVEVEMPVQRISKLQAILILDEYSMLNAVNSLVDAIGGKAKLIWQNCTYIERNNPLVDIVCKQANMTDEQIDEMFLKGSKL